MYKRQIITGSPGTGKSTVADKAAMESDMEKSVCIRTDDFLSLIHISRSRDHVIKAALVKKHPKGEVGKYDCSATYHYELQGEEREYHAYFKEPTRPPVYLYLYYLDNPRKLFSVEEYHYENHKAILLLPVIFLPWILALAAMFLLNIPLPTR